MADKKKAETKSLLCNMGVHAWSNGKCTRCGKKK